MKSNTENNCKNDFTLKIFDEDFNPIKLKFKEPILIGQQILEKAKKYQTDNFILIQQKADGMLEEINLSESVDISEKGIECFFIFESDRVHYFKLNSRKMPWGSNEINGTQLRKLGNIPENQQLFLQEQSKSDSTIADDAVVDLGNPGLEKIYSKRQAWKLKVNGVTIKSDTQSILASNAITEAGFNANEEWILILRIKGQPKQEIKITDTIDLSQPGIEKLRIVQKEINNGEKGTTKRSEFSLLQKDINYLNKSAIQFETFLEGANRWLILSDYRLPKGFNHATTNIAIMIPASYPTALLDMFYCYPHLTTENGVNIPTTEARINIEGKSYQRWSRHLGASRPWNPSTDSVMTHLALVEESLHREVEK